MCLVHPAALTALICAVAVAASAQSTPTDMPKPEEKATGSPTLAVALVGPSREIKLSENTWFRFGAQVQAWFKAGQDRILQPDGSDGGYAFDFYCRRCRFFATGSVVKNVYFNVLFEASNLGRADAATGVKSFAPPSILDAYAQVKFTDYFWLSGGSILLPLTRNGTQPTTTYLSIDNANVDTTPILQGNTNVIRDLGFQANGFFLANHLEYRVGVFQGSRQPALPTQTASHNAPRFVASVSANLWDTETGYVNGGHYFGAKQVLGVMGNFDYQALRTANPSLCSPPTVPCTGAGAGIAKDAYKGFSAAAFINYPLNGPNPKGGDEIVGLLQFGYYDGGFSATNPGSYPAVLKQTNYLAEGAYYSAGLKLSVFGKFEMRKISDDYAAPFKAASNVTWIAGGLKYYVAPFNLMNFGLQYERIIFNDAPSTAQGGTHNVTFQMQLILY
jgi:hypothetical protein